MSLVKRSVIVILPTPHDGFWGFFGFGGFLVFFSLCGVFVF